MEDVGLRQKRPEAVLRAVQVAHLQVYIGLGPQAFVEGRIAELESKLSTSQVIDPTTLDAEGRVVFAATVDLEDLDSSQKVTYQIVGMDEADLKMNKVSITSPIARALIGKYAGDVVEVQAPSGPREYEILEVRYI